MKPLEAKIVFLLATETLHFYKIENKRFNQETSARAQLQNVMSMATNPKSQILKALTKLDLSQCLKFFLHKKLQKSKLLKTLFMTIC